MRTQEQSKLGEEIRDSLSEEVNPVKLYIENILCALEQTCGSPVTLSSLINDLFLPTCHFYLYILNIACSCFLSLPPARVPTSPSTPLLPHSSQLGFRLAGCMSKAVTWWSCCITWPGSEEWDQSLTHKGTSLSTDKSVCPRSFLWCYRNNFLPQ